MKSIISLALLCFTLEFPAFASAQILNNWNTVDTVTAGDFDDLNPSIVNDVFLPYPSGYLWMVFERHTDTESQSAARRFNRSSATWDSAVVVLSSLPSGEEQKYPDY